ncbi:MAG: baseplate assembly protein [Vallitalea sp.]|jgi:phage baseplate assembly protein gpV|nr:baseplate assembly protein [Vallitalea sp.]
MLTNLIEINKSIQTLLNVVKVGKVSSINIENGTIDVVFEDKDNMICPNLPLMDIEYKIPAIGEQVLCLFLPNGIQQGFCLGKFYSATNPPPKQDPNIICKQFADDTYIEYNKKTKQLTINSSTNIIINGNVTVNGNITADNISKEGV